MKPILKLPSHSARIGDTGWMFPIARSHTSPKTIDRRRSSLCADTSDNFGSLNRRLSFLFSPRDSHNTHPYAFATCTALPAVVITASGHKFSLTDVRILLRLASPMRGTFRETFRTLRQARRIELARKTFQDFLLISGHL